MNAVEIMIDQVVKPVPKPDNISPNTKYTTHEGIMTLGESRLRVYILNTGQRIINADDLNEFFGGDLLAMVESINKTD